MTAALKDKNIDVRIDAARALGKLAAQGKPALPALFESAKDTSNRGEGLFASIEGDYIPGSVAEASLMAALED